MKPTNVIKRSTRAIWFVPFVVLCIMLLITAIVAYAARQSVRNREYLRFNNLTQRTRLSIENRLEMYVEILRSTAGLFAVKENVTREEFRHFYERLKVNEKYPGVQGLGYTVRVTAAEKEAFTARMRLEKGLEQFQIYPADASRDESTAIIYLEPLTARNNAVIGFDMTSEITRRTAMEQARDTGAPAASGKVLLLQYTDAPGKEPGFLIYLPVYRGSDEPPTVADRRARLQGYVYSPFRINNLLRGVLGEDGNAELFFEIYDGDAVTPEHLLFASMPDEKSNEALFTQQQKLDFGARSWTLVFHSAPAFESGLSFLPPIIGLGGALSLLLFGITWTLVSARREAERVTQDLQLSETALRASEKHLRAVLDSLFAFVGVMDLRGELQEVNRAALEAAGLEAASVIGKSFAETYWWDYAPGVQNELRAAIRRAAKGEFVRYDVPVRLKGDELKAIDFAIAPLYDEQGRIMQLIASGVDVHQRKLFEQEIQNLLREAQNARSEAEVANRLKDEFLATLSHELRTPLNSILGWAQMIGTGHLTVEETRRAVQTIERNAKTQTQLVEDILDVSRIITGKMSIELVHVDFGAMVVRALETIVPTAAAKNVELRTFLGEREYFVRGDEQRLQQMAWNLLSNAVKFTPAGGYVAVTLDTPDEQLRLRVQDTGIGIRPEVLPFVFERFRQADSSTTRQHGGLGLGLAIVRHLVEGHGGTVSVTSGGSGKGAEFIVLLPLADTLPDGADAAAQTAADNAPSAI